MPGSCQAILWSILLNHHNNHRLVELLLISHIRRQEQGREGIPKAPAGAVGGRGVVFGLVAGHLAAVVVKGSKFGLRHVKLEAFPDRAECIYKTTGLVTADGTEESSTERRKGKTAGVASM